MDIRPDYANLKVGNSIKKVSVEDIKVGDIIVVKPGERIPLDGKVVEGRTMLDTSALTGESVPREVYPGEAVLSGTVNQTSLISVEVTKILDLVQNASSRKAPTENFITKFAGYYTPAVVFSSAGCSRCRFLRLGLQSTHIPCNLMSLRSGNIHTPWILRRNWWSFKKRHSH